MTQQITLADLSLFPATSEQLLESRKRHAELWARNQNVEEYLHRDAVMDADEHAANGKLITWVLAPRGDPTTHDFMSSCETFCRTALVARHSSGTCTPNVEEVTAYAVASVFTPARHRKRGYARHLMRLLHWVLAPRSTLPTTFPAEWGAPPDADMLTSLGVANAQFSVLYSDIGPEFYRSCGTDATSRNGWLVTGAAETSWTLDDPAGHSNSDTSTTAKPAANVMRLKERDVLALYAHDACWIRDDLARAPEAGGRRTLFTFLPDKGVGAFVLRRTMNFTPDMEPILPTSQWGLAILPDDDSGSAQTTPLAQLLAETGLSLRPLPFVTWTLDLRTSPRTLVVARLRADERTLPVLLDALLAAACEEQVEKVELWYLRSELRAIAENRGWKTDERTSHLSAVKWYGDDKEDELEWVYNEKFSWC